MSEKDVGRPFESPNSQMLSTTFRMNRPLSRPTVLCTAQSVRSEVCAASFCRIKIVMGSEPSIISLKIFVRFGRGNDVPCFIVYGSSS